MSKHRRRKADGRLDQPTEAVLGVAISEHAAALVVIRRDDEVTVVRNAMRCSDSAHLLAVLAAVLAQRRSALERGYDITAIAFTWTPNVGDWAHQLGEWLTTLKESEVVTVEGSDAAAELRGDHEHGVHHGNGSAPANDRTYVVSQEEWPTETNIGAAVGPATSVILSPAAVDLALARGAAQVAMRISAPPRARPPRGRTLVRAAAITASVAGVLGILTASLLRLMVVSTPAPTAPSAVPGTDSHPAGADTPDTSSLAAQPPASMPTRAAETRPSAIDMAQSTQAHYLQAPESSAGPPTSGPPPLAPPPPQAATQPAIGSPPVPDTANTDAPPPPPADASASQAAPLPASPQTDSSDATPPPPPAADSGPAVTPPPPPPDNPSPPSTQ